MKKDITENLLELKVKGTLLMEKKKNGKPWIQCSLLKSYQTYDLAQMYLNAGYKINDEVEIVITPKPKE